MKRKSLLEEGVRRTGGVGIVPAFRSSFLESNRHRGPLEITFLIVIASLLAAGRRSEAISGKCSGTKITDLRLRDCFVICHECS